MRGALSATKSCIIPYFRLLLSHPPNPAIHLHSPLRIIHHTESGQPLCRPTPSTSLTSH